MIHTETQACIEQGLNKPERLAHCIDSMDHINFALQGLLGELVGNAALLGEPQGKEPPQPTTLLSVLDQGPMQLEDTKARCMKSIEELRTVLL